MLSCKLILHSQNESVADYDRLGHAIASTPGRIFAFTSDLAKIRPGIDCMLENMLPSLINRAHEVSLAFQLFKLLQTCLNF